MADAEKSIRCKLYFATDFQKEATYHNPEI